MSSEAFLNSNPRPGFWPWLMGGITFLITTLFPPLGFPLNYSLIPIWLSPLVAYGSQGGIAWQVLHDVQENVAASYPVSALFWMILPYCSIPIVLTLSSVLTWRRVVHRMPRPTAQRGLLAVVLAVALSLLAIGLLDLLILGPLALFAPHEAYLLGLLIIAAAALGQSLWVLPGLLLAGATLAIVQARSRTRYPRRGMEHHLGSSPPSGASADAERGSKPPHSATNFQRESAADHF